MFIEEKLIPDYKTHASSNVFSEIGMLTSKKIRLAARLQEEMFLTFSDNLTKTIMDH